jgi:hypothetical protein
MKNNNLFIIFAINGFGNRYNAILNGVIFANKHNLNFKICWDPCNESEVEFNDVLEKSSHETITHAQFFTIAKQPEFKIYLLRDTEYRQLTYDDRVFTCLRRTWMWKHFSMLLEKKVEFISIDQINKINNGIFLSSSIKNLNYDSNVHQVMSQFPIKKYITETAKKFIKEKNIDKTVEGLMIRKTDAFLYTYRNAMAYIGEICIPQDSIRDSDENYYFSYVNENPHRRFFVMSDDINVVNMFKNLPNVIVCDIQPAIIFDKKTNNLYRDKQSVINGLINLIILTRTNINTQTTNSTFLNVAKLYQHINF